MDHGPHVLEERVAEETSVATRTKHTQHAHVQINFYGEERMPEQVLWTRPGPTGRIEGFFKAMSVAAMSLEAGCFTIPRSL